MRSMLFIFLLLIFSCSERKKAEPTTEGLARLEKPTQGKIADPVLNKVQSGETDALFRHISLFSDRLQIDIPVQLHVMAPKIFKLKYPKENQKSTKAYCNEDGTVSLLISPQQEPAVQTDLPKYKKILDDDFGRNPSIDFTKSGIRKINGRDFIVLEMITPAMDTKVFNLMFVTSSEGKLLIGTFNCTVEKLEGWQNIMVP